MKWMLLLHAAINIAALAVSPLQSVQAGGLERLYILNCGKGTAGDVSRWAPGQNCLDKASVIGAPSAFVRRLARQ